MTKLNVLTSFNTSLQLDAESLGKRVIAFLIDFAFIVLYWYSVNKIASLFAFDSNAGGDGYRIRAGWYSLLFLPIMFYTLVSEVASGGYTLGKYLLKIKVVKLDGYQPSFVDFFIRWIFRAVDIHVFIIIAVLSYNPGYIVLGLLATGVVGTVAIARSKKGQRLGDLVAGTSVIQAKQIQKMDITILKELAEDYKPTYAQVMALSDNDARIIKETYEAALKTQNMNVIDQLVAKLESVMKVKSEGSPRQFIEVVLKDFNYYTQNL